MGANVSEREVQGLPVNGRQMSQLMLQAPGSQNAGTGTWGDIRFSGRAVEQNVIKYDGIEGSAGSSTRRRASLNGENASLFKLQASLENVQEFRVESSGYPAEYGTGTGGQVSVITKSGGNSVHGSVFEYLRSDKLDAANYFDSQRNADGSIIAEAGSAPTVPKSPLSLNQFGGSIGGPLAKDRAFFFGSYEGYRLDAGRNLDSGRAERGRLGARGSGDRRAALRVRRPGRASFCRARRRTLTSTSMQWQANQHVSENAFSAPSGCEDQQQLVDRTSASSTTRPRATIRRTSAAGSSRRRSNPTNADLQSAGHSRQRRSTSSSSATTARRAPKGADTQAGFENIAISLDRQRRQRRYRGPGVGLVARRARRPGPRQQRGQRPRRAVQPVLADLRRHTSARIAGNHFVKIGGDVRLIRMSTDQLGGITYTYPNVTAFLANTPTSIQYFGDLSEPSPFHNGATGLKHIEQEYYVGFAQDEWRVRPNFTLNYGLRYDYYVPLHGSRQPHRQVQRQDRTDRSGHDAVLHLEEDELPAARVGDLLGDVEDRVQGRLRHLRRTRPDRGSDSADRSRTHQHDADVRAAARVSGRRRP